MTLIPYFKLRIYLGEMPITFTEKCSLDGNKLVLNYEEIENIIKEKKGQFLELFYFNKENIHDILYQTENVINIEDNKIRKLSDLFYLDLLIMDNPNIINYKFSKNIIIKFCEELSTEKKELKKAILSKIIIDCIECYKGFGDYDEKINERSLNKLSNLCKKKIKNIIKNNEIFSEVYNYENLKEMSIDKFYAKIIINKLFNCDFSIDDNVNDITNIMDDLEIGEIKITENIFYELNTFLTNNKSNESELYIIKIEDFINKKKINFYYIILKYILKNSSYIYHINFLLNTRALLISIIKNNLYTLLSIIAKEDLNNDIKERLDYIIKSLIDLDYYYEKYEQMKKCDKINYIINDKRFRYDFPLMQIVMNIKINDININEKEINSIINKWEPLKRLINEKKFKKIKNKKELYKYFQDSNNKILLLELFGEDNYNYFQKLDINYPEEYIEDNNIIKNSDSTSMKNSNIENIINEQSIEISEYNDIKNDDTSIIIQSYTIQDIKEKDNVTCNEIIINNNSIPFDLNMFRQSDKYKLIEFYKIVEEKNNLNSSYFYYTKNLSKGHYLIGGNTNKIMIYNKYFENQLEIKLSIKPQNIYEIQKNNNKNEIYLMACCRYRIIFISINLRNYTYDDYTKWDEEYGISYDSLYKINNKYLTCGIKGGFMLNDNNDRFYYRNKKIFKTNYFNGININENIFAFISNKAVPHGDDILIIYDFNKDKIRKEINNYSFKISNNNLYLIDLNKIRRIQENRQILFCSCSSDNYHQTNGFLIVDINLENKEFFECFYDTEEFEPHCFCQLLIVDNNNSITSDISNKKNINIIETEYFLVGGFDPLKRMGCIKLYKIKYNKNNNKVNIIYIFDIVTENNDEFSGFDMEVSCITQSNITGNLLITCLDGNVFLFKPPNLELFSQN